MKILVTGGTGFIGSHTAVQLINAGHDAVILDNFSNSSPDVADKIKMITSKSVKLYHDDILDRGCLKAIFSEQKIDAVIHFAGLKSVSESTKKPLEYYENNVSGTITLCEEMLAAGCKNLIFSSSATVYSAENAVPFKETDKTGTINPYGASKLMVEDILRDLCKAEPSLNVMILRYFNPVGAHESGLIGENPNGIPNNLVPYIAKVAAGKLNCLNVYGNDYDTPDGTGVRDYIHVSDLAEGHVKALEYLAKQNGICETVNLGTGKGSSVLDMVAAYEKASGADIPYRFAPRRAGDVAVSYADAAKAEELLGWKAERSINQMCADSWNFAKNLI